MSTADAPLLADPSSRDSTYNDDEGDVTSQISGADGSPTLFVWLLSASAGISGLLFGYDTGIISATLVSLSASPTGPFPGSTTPLTTLDKSLITSSTALLALLASPPASLLADRLGRRPVILLADALFALGALTQCFADSVSMLVVGRAIVGAAVGAASFAVPLYVAEAAPGSARGRLVGMNVVLVTLGQVVAYLVGWFFAERYQGGEGWRWMVGLGAAPAVAQELVMLSMPETPRWLVKAGRGREARVVVERVYGTSSGKGVVEGVVKSIEREMREEEQLGDGGWGQLFKIRRNKRALAIACLLQGLQQLCGFNSLMYFSATIFTMVGFAVPTLTSLTVAATNFVFTVVAILLIDRIGRRRVLLYSIPLMVVGLLLSAYGFAFIDVSTFGTTSASSDGTQSTGLDAHGAASMILFSIMVYVAAYAIGLGNVPWMQSELFGLDVRSKGSGIATATNWLANFVIGMTFLPLMEALTPSWTFVLYAIICATGYLLVYKIYPETAGLSLEEAAGLLDGDAWGVP